MSYENMSIIPNNATLEQIRENYKDIIKKHYAHDVYDFEGRDVYFKKDVDLPELRDNINRTIRIANKDNNNKKFRFYGSSILLIIIVILNIVGLILANYKWDDSIKDDGNYFEKTIYRYYKHWIIVIVCIVVSIIGFLYVIYDSRPGDAWVTLIPYLILWIILSGLD
jgi:hypothetical protein